MSMKERVIPPTKTQAAVPDETLAHTELRAFGSLHCLPALTTRTWCAYSNHGDDLQGPPRWLQDAAIDASQPSAPNPNVRTNDVAVF